MTSGPSTAATLSEHPTKVVLGFTFSASCTTQQASCETCMRGLLTNAVDSRGSTLLSPQHCTISTRDKQPFETPCATIDDACCAVLVNAKYLARLEAQFKQSADMAKLHPSILTHSSGRHPKHRMKDVAQALQSALTGMAWQYHTWQQQPSLMSLHNATRLAHELCKLGACNIKCSC